MSATKKYLFERALTSLSIWGRADNVRFPVRRVFCIGKNYEDHVKEMGGTLQSQPPVLFTKPDDAIIDVSLHSSSKEIVIPLPSHSKNVHWEAEFVVALSKGGRNIDPKNANDHIFGYGVGIDMTARDVQDELKKKGRPWDISKGFDYSGPVGALMPKAEFGEIKNQRLQLLVNGVVKQDTTLDQMIWSIPQQISLLSKIYTLKPGDIIFTGTPSGVNQMNPGDSIAVSCVSSNSKGVNGGVYCNFKAGPYEI
jgi:fumarylpyruvate hydrolase